MGFEPGIIIAIAAVLLFYLRMIILQRQKVKQISTQMKAADKKKTRKNQPPPPSAVPRLEITRPFLVGAGVVIILLGAGLAAAPWLDESTRSWWWFPVTLGIFLMSLGIR